MSIIMKLIETHLHHSRVTQAIFLSVPSQKRSFCFSKETLFATRSGSLQRSYSISKKLTDFLLRIYLRRNPRLLFELRHIPSLLS